VPATVRVSRRGEERIRGGHPWVYRSDIESVDAESGDLVAVVAGRRMVGWALWSDASQISLRMLAVDREIDERALWHERLGAAIAYRATLDIDATAYRLVHAEADRLPGLIVDRYDDYLVVQTLIQATDRRLALFCDLLVEQVAPRGILARNDPRVRRLEGLPEEVTVAFGEIPAAVEVREGDLHYEVDLRHGQKTGLFLDQRENHAAAAAYARGRGLDAFTYAGGFALAMATRCDSVLALESSSAAVDRARANASRNGRANVEVREQNVFDELRELEVSGERFDTIVLDPPAFARNKSAVARAVAGYREINLRALKLLRVGGHLITCSCSYNVGEALFTSVLEEAARDARAVVAIVERRTQARDHPVLLGVPETHYLKCFVLRRVA